MGSQRRHASKRKPPSPEAEGEGLEGAGSPGKERTALSPVPEATPAACGCGRRLLTLLQGERGEAPDDTGWGREGGWGQGHCALCRVTAHDGHTGGPPRVPWFPIHGIRTPWGVSVLLKGQKEERTQARPAPQAGTGQCQCGVHCPWDRKEGPVGYWSPSPMYTFYKSLRSFPHEARG